MQFMAEPPLDVLPLHFCQRLIQIGQQVVDMLDADRQAYGLFPDTRLRQFFR